MKKRFTYLVVAFLFAALSLNAQKTFDKLPTNPEPGKCYVRCITPPVWETVTERIMVKPAYTVLTVIPAEYKWEEERVLVKPATKRYEYVPAVFESYEEEYLAQEKRNKITLVAPKFSPSAESILVQPKSHKWQYTKLADCESDDPFDCRVLCYVETPEVKTQFITQILDKDASYTSEPVGYKTQKVKKWRIVKEAYNKEYDIPAVYKTIKKRILVKDETVEKKTVPAVYETYTREVLKSEGGLTYWKEVQCDLVDYNVLPIYYELGSARLTPASKKTINNTLLKMMREQKDVKIELSSHTDSRGNDDFNMRLSQKRAQAVVNYLVSKGINASRLVAKGYGETRLINRCANGVPCTEKEHQENRRTQFRIVNY